MFLLYMYVPTILKIPYTTLILIVFFFYFLVYDHLIEFSEKEGVLFLGKDIFAFEPSLTGTLRRHTGRAWYSKQCPY